MKSLPPQKMHLTGCKPRQLVLILSLSLIMTSTAIVVPASNSLNLPLADHHRTSPGKVVFTTNRTSLQKRRIRIQQLGDGWIIQYKKFAPFKPSWFMALSLGYFWTGITTQVADRLSMPDDRFLKNTFALHMPLDPIQPLQGPDMLLEIIRFDRPVSRELVLAVAAVMTKYTMRGFCGVFNARLSQGPGTTPIWIVFKVRGLAKLHALTSGQA